MLFLVPFLLFATLFADFCNDDPKGRIRDQVLFEFELSANASTEYAGYTMIEIFDYVTACSGEKIDVFASVSSSLGLSDDPRGYVDNITSTYNVSNYIATLENYSMDGEELRLVPSFKSQLLTVNDELLSIVSSVFAAGDAITDCSSASTLYDEIIDLPCQYVKDSFAAIACMIVIVVVVMLFAACASSYLTNVVKAWADNESEEEESAKVTKKYRGMEDTGMEDDLEGGSRLELPRITGNHRIMSQKFFKKNSGNVMTEDDEKKLGGHVSGGAEIRTSMDLPPPTDHKLSGQQSGGVPPLPDYENSESRSN